jgi:hypothetical protein
MYRQMMMMTMMMMMMIHSFAKIFSVCAAAARKKI